MELARNREIDIVHAIVQDREAALKRAEEYRKLPNSVVRYRQADVVREPESALQTEGQSICCRHDVEQQIFIWVEAGLIGAEHRSSENRYREQKWDCETHDVRGS